MKARHEEAILKIRTAETEKRERQIERANMWKARYQDRIKEDIRKKEESKERAEHKGKFDRILGNYNDLVKWVLKPDKNHFVPEEFRRTLAEVLQAFDLQTENSKKLEEKTGRTSQKTLELRKLNAQLEKLASTPTENGSPLFKIDNYIIPVINALAEKLEKNGNNIDALDEHDIKEIDRLLSAVKQNVPC
jgi:hypothetical protein